ncbi:MAG: hypothetical protein AAF449_25100, partial [Myxococcota bacterium]
MTRSLHQSALALFAGLAVTLCGGQADAADHSAPLITPTHTTDGRVSSGSKSLWQKNNFAHVVVCLDNDAICTFNEFFGFENGYISPVFFIDRATRIEGRSTIFEGGMRTAVESSESIGNYRMVSTLRDDGLVEVR